MKTAEKYATRAVQNNFQLVSNDKHFCAMVIHHTIVNESLTSKCL